MPKADRPRFQYKRRDPDTVRQRANQRGGDFDSMFKEGTRLWKPRDGKNIIRILPPTWDDANHYGYEIWCNYGVGVDEQSYLSLHKMKGIKDPLAEARKQADRNGDKKLSEQLTPRKRILMYVIDRNAEDEGPQLWSAPWTIDKDLCNLSFDEDTRDVIMIDDPEEGSDFAFHKEGTGLTTKYPAAQMRIKKPSRLHEDDRIYDEWLEFVHNHPIPDCLNFYDYDHIASVFEGFVAKPEPTKEVDEDDDDPPTVKKVKPVDHDEDGVVNEEPEASVSRIRDRLMGRRKASNPLPDDDEPAPRARR
jgi:hypothetical protein